MITRTQKVKLAIFLLTGIFILTGIKLFEKIDTYYVYFSASVSGLEPGSPVKYNGVRVGRVEKIDINPKKVSEVVIILSVRKGTPVKKDTRAIMSQVGITGLKFLEFVGGSDSSDFLKSGDNIIAGESFIDELTGKATAIALKTELLVDNLLKLTDTSNRTKLIKLLEEMDKLAFNSNQFIEKNGQQVSALLDQFNSLAAETRQTVVQTRQLLSDNRTTLKNIMKNMDSTVLMIYKSIDEKQVRRIIDNTDRVIDKLHSTLGKDGLQTSITKVDNVMDKAYNLLKNINLTVMQSREDIHRALTFLRESSENLSEFSQSIKNDPSLLLRRSGDEEK